MPPRARPGLKRINLYMDEKVIDGYRWLAESRSTAASELIRQAVKEYLIRELKKEQEDIQVLNRAVNG